MAYVKQSWEDLPSKATPITAVRLNKMETQYDEAVADSKTYTDQAISQIPQNPSGETPRVDLITGMVTPVYISHRGAPNVYPEHSIEGYRASFQAGFSPEADVRALANGKLVCIHDATTTRTMNISKSVSQVEEAEWRSSTIKPASAFGRISSSQQGSPVFFEDYLDEFGGKILLWPEIKVTGAPATNAIKAVTDRNLHDAVVIQSGDLNTCRQIVAAGCHALYLSDTANPVTVASAGVEFIGVGQSVSNDYVASCTAAGLKVVAYTTNSKTAADTQISRGCIGVFSDDPWDASRLFTPQDFLDLRGGDLTPAMAHSRAHSGNAAGPGTSQVVRSSNGVLTFSTTEPDGKPNSVRLGILGMNLSAGCTVRFWVEGVKPAQVTGPESAWLFGVYWGKQGGDAAVNEEPQDSMFRLAMVRRNGNKNAYEKRTLTGTTSSLGNVAAPSTPYCKPGGRSIPMQFEVEFTTTSVAIRNLTLNDTDLEVSGASLSIPGGYISLNVNGAISRFWGVTLSER